MDALMFYFSRASHYFRLEYSKVLRIYKSFRIRFIFIYIICNHHCFKKMRI